MRLRKRLRHVHARTHTHTRIAFARTYAHSTCIMHQWQKSLSTRSALCARAHTTAFRRRRLRLVLIFVVGSDRSTHRFASCVRVCTRVDLCEQSSRRLLQLQHAFIIWFFTVAFGAFGGDERLKRAHAYAYDACIHICCVACRSVVVVVVVSVAQ